MLAVPSTFFYPLHPFIPVHPRLNLLREDRQIGNGVRHGHPGSDSPASSSAAVTGSPTTVTALDDAHIAQCLNYMKATRVETCLLVNFGKARIQVRRLGMTRGASAGEVELEVKDVQ